MRANFEEFHGDLRAVARDLLAGSGPLENGGDPRASLDGELLAASGWSGLEVPEDMGGSGATFAEVAIVLQEMGHSGSLSSSLGSVVLGVGTLNLLEPDEARRELLSQVASGRARIAVALPTGDDAVPESAPSFHIESSGGRLGLSGRAPFVPDAPQADRLLLLARDPGGAAVVVDVPPEAPGLAVQEQEVLDATRRFGVVRADDVQVNEAAVWRFAADPEESTRLLLERGAVAVACDSLGLAQAMLDATVAYAAVRQQFGRPIGSFQAVKHACADMLVQVAVSRELLAPAVRRVASSDGDDSAAVSMAKSFICEGSVNVVGKAMQLHGGIGYTWESGIHSYLKRAVLNRSFFGSPAMHRKRLAQRYAG
ncbi:MAG TPA: acyl-CoA dehydrogenase family protein [Acidimicrobiales bacterium]|nr:acyl-CoA dehydrogenase family protein [Acidimicrobiales bacterium]